MIKEIKYTGITHSPSDYDCPDGDIAAMINLVNENGNLSPITPPETLLTLAERQRIIYIHKSSDYYNFIVATDYERMNNVIQIDYNGNVYCTYPLASEIKITCWWADIDYPSMNDECSPYEYTLQKGVYHTTIQSHEDNLFKIDIDIKEDDSFIYSTKRLFYQDKPQYSPNKPETLISFFTKDNRILQRIISIPGDIYQINSIGNTIVILTSNGIIYSLFKSNTYIVMTDKPPFACLSFGLKGEVVNRGITKIDYNTDNVINTALSLANSYVQESHGNGYFLFPFLIRYAYELYDGSTYMASAPVMMLPCSETNPMVEHMPNTGAIRLFFNKCNILDYRITNFDEIINELKHWDNIVKKINVYISSPIYLYNQNATSGGKRVEDFEITVNNIYNLGIFCKMNNKGEYATVNGEHVYCKHGLFTESSGGAGYKMLTLLQKTDDDISKSIKNAANFYKIYSIEIDKLKAGECEIKLKDKVLLSLESQEDLKDEYGSLDTLVPSYSYTYNSRLNLANIRNRLFSGYSSDTLHCFHNGRLNNLADDYKYTVYTFINDDSKDIIVKNDSHIKFCDGFSVYLYYPSTKAYKMIIEMEDTRNNIKKYSTIKLEEHPLLHGAFYFNSLKQVIAFVNEVPQELLSNNITNDNSVAYKNMIYTSDVNNPFQFPVSGHNAVGMGEILGISSATKALSQGQFGQFPLYAFTDEGVWALEVSTEGTFSAKQPITRDACNNPDSITQIDTAVLFTSERGIMLIQGSDSTCISDTMNELPFDISYLKEYEEIIRIVGFTKEQLQYCNFFTFLKGCSMSYDYKNQRIIIFNKKYAYAYLWSLKSKKWSTIISNFHSSINSYPDSYIMTKDNTLINISNTDNGNLKGIKGIVITRPLKLDVPDTFKTIESSIHRGLFAKGHVKTVLYGSRDLINWFIVSSSNNHYLRGFRGTPFKYFRFVIITEFNSGECLSGTSISFNPRQTNKLR